MGNAAFVCTYIDPCNTLCNKRQILFNNSEWESPILIDNNSQRVSQTQEIPNSKNVKLSFGKNSINEIDVNHKNNRGSIINSNINTNVYSGLNSVIPNPKNNSNNMNNTSNKIPVKKNNQQKRTLQSVLFLRSGFCSNPKSTQKHQLRTSYSDFPILPELPEWHPSAHRSVRPRSGGRSQWWRGRACWAGAANARAG